jgi:nucleoside-diphosphate-sugar epimerase
MGTVPVTGARGFMVMHVAQQLLAGGRKMLGVANSNVP